MNYCGYAKKVNSSFGEIFNLQLNLTQLRQILEDAETHEKGTFVNRGGDEVVKISMLSMKNPSEFSTHYLKVDTYQSEKKEEKDPIEAAGEAAREKTRAELLDEQSDDLPF